MGFCTSKLTPELDHPDGLSYEVTVETGAEGRVRLNVASINGDDLTETRAQGADLTPAECRSLAHMLLSTAELAESAPRTREKP
jgi:hypothetical protein